MSALRSSDTGEDSFDERLLTVLATIGRQLRRRVGRPQQFEELTGAQVELVRLVRRRPGLSIAEAAGELHLAPNTISTLVGQLGEAGLVLRRADQDDRRVARLELGAQVREEFHALRDRRLVALTESTDSLSQAERRALEAALPALERVAQQLGSPSPPHDRSDEHER